MRIQPTQPWRTARPAGPLDEKRGNPPETFWVIGREKSRPIEMGGSRCGLGRPGSTLVHSCVPSCLRKISVHVRKLHSVIVVVQWHTCMLPHRPRELYKPCSACQKCAEWKVSDPHRSRDVLAWKGIWHTALFAVRVACSLLGLFTHCATRHRRKASMLMNSRFLSSKSV